MTHKEEHFTSSEILRDAVIGMSDGLTVPFALAAGLSGAVSNNSIIITAGLAEIIAGSIAMGLGGYLAGQTEKEHYVAETKRENWEIDNLPLREWDEVQIIFKEMGLSDEIAKTATQEIVQDRTRWLNFMMKYELGLEQPATNRASISALTIGIAYAIGGIVPLLPYFVTQTPIQGLQFSAIVTLVCLFIFGWFKSKIMGQTPLKGALRFVFVGALASAAAFLVAKWIG